MEQPTITNFFNKRKRSSALDSNKLNSKVLVLDRHPADKSDHPLDHEGQNEGECEINRLHSRSPTQILYSAKQLSSTKIILRKSKSTSKPKVSSQKDASRAKGTHNQSKGLDKDKPKPRTQLDIRDTFLNVKKSVRFELKGSLSPKKVNVTQVELGLGTNGLVVRPTPEAGKSSADEPRNTVETTMNQKVPPALHNIQESPVVLGLGLDSVERSEITCPKGTETVQPMEVGDSKVGLGLQLKLDRGDRPRPRPSEGLERVQVKDDSSLASRPGSGDCVDVNPTHAQSSSEKQETKDKTTVNARRDLGLMTPKRMNDGPKGLSLNEIKSRLSRSAKLAEIRESLAKINKGNEQLKDIEQRKKQWQSESPKLGQFRTIAVEVKSPMKDVCSSPKKTFSPTASPSKSPAYQRLSSLAASGPPVLALPFKHRCLVEVFRCVDTIVSLMFNRKEVVTFKKLKPAVQQMLRRNFAESHLGQIKRVFPSAFSFRQEKARSFAYSTRPDQYELTVTPLVAAETAMTPACLLERRETFAAGLVDRVKTEHEEFLSRLEPPMTIPRERLTRWHPEFELDGVREVEPCELPLPPGVTQHSSAKDVLDKAKSLFSCNERMEKALEKVSQISSAARETTQPKPSEQPSPISAALRGIPKSILEKVRANQAARAMVAMSRTPAEERQQVQYSRLPELARIVRNIYVGEKKKVMPLETAVEKLENSYRERLSAAELEEHVRLIMKSVPGWLEIQNVRKMDFLKLSKNADMSKVMTRLEQLAAGEK